jgi:hypothetical protein
VDFFDDDAPGPQTPAAPPRRRRRPADRRRTRIQRIVLIVVVLFLVIFGATLWLRSCQHSRKVSAYRTYFADVTTAIKDSDSLGRQLHRFLHDPTRLTAPELRTALAGWTARQQEIATRVGRFSAPGPLAEEQAQFVSGQQVRARGFALLQSFVTDSLSKRVSAAKLSAIGGYFTGPDAYYMDKVYTQARDTLQQQGVTDVVVPTSTYYLTAPLFDRTLVAAALTHLGQSSTAQGQSTHGVALAGVSATSGSTSVKLQQGHTVNVTAAADLAFVVSAQNQGQATETNVPVEVTLVLPDKSTLKQTASIASIQAGKTADVSVSGFAIPTSALSKVVTLKAKVGPVPQERVQSNNSGEFKFLLQLQ